MRRITALPCSLLLLSCLQAQQAPLPGRFAGDGITVGMEYVVFNSERFVRSSARAFAETGMTGMKHFVEAVDWGTMQAGPRKKIDFSKLDWFVHAYQQCGFSELTISLKSHSSWASKDIKAILGKHSLGSNPTPRPEYLPHYQRWVAAVVERYDADGHEDMPGLRWPVRYFEIGNEFSSFEPEPVEDYLEMLEHAYQAAHGAYDAVLVAHVAFLLTPVNMAVEDPADYDERWRSTYRKDTHHDLADMRALLDRPDVFDVLNLHNLGDPYEIEDLVRWLDYETGRRGYAKPIIISDTTPTSYIGWGSATRSEGPKERLGVLARPAREADRRRLAAYFTKLIAADPETLAWTRGFVAADHVQRTVVAAEQGIRLINLAFVGDIAHATWKIFEAGAGISAWGGAIRAQLGTGRILEKYPAFYAVQQLMGQLAGYRSIRRLPMADPQARVYEVQREDGRLWIAWRDPQAALLPEDGAPSLQVVLETGTRAVLVEPVITGMGQETAERRRLAAEGGRVRLELVHTPVYVLPDGD